MKNRITLAQEAELAGPAQARYKGWKAQQRLGQPPDFVELLALVGEFPSPNPTVDVELDQHIEAGQALSAFLDDWDALDNAERRLRITRIAAKLSMPRPQQITRFPMSRTRDDQVRFQMRWDGTAEPIDALWAIAKEALAR